MSGEKPLSCCKLKKYRYHKHLAQQAARLAQRLGLSLQIVYLIDLQSRWKCDGDILGTAL